MVHVIHGSLFVLISVGLASWFLLAVLVGLLAGQLQCATLLLLIVSRGNAAQHSIDEGVTHQSIQY